MSEFYKFWQEIQEEKMIRETAEIMASNNIDPDDFLSAKVTESHPELISEVGFWRGLGDAVGRGAKTVAANWNANMNGEIADLQTQASQIEDRLRKWHNNIAQYDRTGEIDKTIRNALGSLQQLQSIKIDPRVAEKIRQNYITGNRYDASVRNRNQDRLAQVRQRFAQGSQQQQAQPQGTQPTQAASQPAQPASQNPNDPLATSTMDTSQMGSVPSPQHVETPEEKIAREKQERLAQEKEKRAKQKTWADYVRQQGSDGGTQVASGW